VTGFPGTLVIRAELWDPWGVSIPNTPIAAPPDYDYTANRVGWQTAAAARMKNPFAESQNLDPGGRFIRSHLPEIAHLPDNIIHAPHRAGSGVSLNGYPAPIV